MSKRNVKNVLSGLKECLNEEDIKKHSPQPMIDNSYPIGYFTDLGYIMINNTRYEKGHADYIWITDMNPIKFSCNFVTWLDRIIIAQGNNYWEWK